MPYFPKDEERAYFCPNCKAWFVPSSISCCVNHTPGECCHMYERMVPAPQRGKQHEILNRRREMTRINRDTYQLSSGRQISANHGLISIAWTDSHAAGPDGPQWEIGEGYDGHLMPDGLRSYGDLGSDGSGWEEKPWTAEERAELADFMIAQWQAFKAGVVPAEDPSRA